MEENVGELRVRALEVENMIKRIAAESLALGVDGGVGGGGFELEKSDPLLDKFKALEERLDDEGEGNR